MYKVSQKPQNSPLFCPKMVAFKKPATVWAQPKACVELEACGLNVALHCILWGAGEPQRCMNVLK